MPSSRKHTSTSKQLEQSTFLRLIDSLGSDSDFCTAVQSIDDINRPRFLNQTIHTQAASVGFIIYHSNPLQYIQSRLSSYDPTLLSSTGTYLQKLFQIHTTIMQSQRRRRSIRDGQPRSGPDRDRPRPTDLRPSRIEPILLVRSSPSVSPGPIGSVHLNCLDRSVRSKCKLRLKTDRSGPIYKSYI